MKNDPFCLFQELTWKASLGVLSADGNLCVSISTYFESNFKDIKKKRREHDPKNR
jgi:predicted class III extradiol MEMO1 family dioxygenase